MYPTDCFFAPLPPLGPDDDDPDDDPDDDDDANDPELPRPDRPFAMDDVTVVAIPLVVRVSSPSNLDEKDPSAARRTADDDVETSPRRRRGSVDALTRDASTNARRSARRRPNIVAVDQRRPRHNEVDDDDARVVAGVNIVVDDERVVGTKTRR